MKALYQLAPDVRTSLYRGLTWLENDIVQFLERFEYLYQYQCIITYLNPTGFCNLYRTFKGNESRQNFTISLKKKRQLENFFPTFLFKLSFFFLWVRWVSKAQNEYIFTIFFIYPMKYFIPTVYHIKDTYLISTLWNFY